jgi:hypothetical protein
MEERIEAPEKQKVLNAVIQFLKLRTGENLIAMTEFDDETGVFTLHFPLQIQFVSTPMKAQGLSKLNFWLPKGIVEEQKACVFADEVVTICDVTDEYCAIYTQAVIKDTLVVDVMREAMERGDEDSAAKMMAALQPGQQEEEEAEESNSVIEDALNKWKQRNIN